MNKAGLFSRGNYSHPAEAMQPAALPAAREVSPSFLKGDLGCTSWFPTQIGMVRNKGLEKGS